MTCSCRSGLSTKPSHPFLSQPEATMHRTLPVLRLALVPALASAQATDASRALAQDAVIVDTHIDAPGMLMDGWMDLGKEAEGREFDYPKARAGGLDVAFMSIYTSTRQDEDDSAWQVANEMIEDRKRTRLNSSHECASRMQSSA